VELRVCFFSLRRKTARTSCLEYNLNASEAPRILEAGLAQVVERLRSFAVASSPQSGETATTSRLEYNPTGLEKFKASVAGLAQLVERLRNSVLASFVCDENRKNFMLGIQSERERSASHPGSRLSSGGRAAAELRRRFISAERRNRNDFAVGIQSNRLGKVQSIRCRLSSGGRAVAEFRSRFFRLRRKPQELHAWNTI